MSDSALQRARHGDERAFGELTGAYRRELEVHCYRMLGSLTEAEDVLQETLFAAWRGLGAYRGQASVRTWLYRIATNRCLNVRRSAARQAPTQPLPPYDVPDPTSTDQVRWLQPHPGWDPAGGTEPAGASRPAPGSGSASSPQDRWAARENVELALITALQLLPGRQAAVVLLRDALEFTTAETAGILEISPVAVKAALQRARAALSVDRVEPVAAPHTGTAEQVLARRFAEAYIAGNIAGLLELLASDAWLSMPPAPQRYQGHRAITGFWSASFGWRGDRTVVLQPLTANGQPAFAGYLAEPGTSMAKPSGIYVLSMAGGRIHGITRFLLPRLYPRFGLPCCLELP